jgi:hypothetical protein
VIGVVRSAWVIMHIHHVQHSVNVVSINRYVQGDFGVGFDPVRRIFLPLVIVPGVRIDVLQAPQAEIFKVLLRDVHVLLTILIH